MRKYRSYKFTNKKHSKGGIRSSIAGVISLLCTTISVSRAYITKGEAGTYLALFGVIAIGCCIYGVVTGKQSFREEEVYHLFSGIGTVLNLMLTIFWGAVVVMGFLI